MQFHGARKTGRGDQVNGLYMEVGSGWKGEFPELPGRFENMRFDGNGDGTSTQTNGMVVVFVGESSGG